MLPEDEAEYCHMWDGSEDWFLIRHNAEFTALTIHFAGHRPDVQEIMALRKLLPAYQNLPPNQVRAMLGESNTLELGPMSRLEARAFAGRCQGMGLSLTERDASYTSYLPCLRTGNSLCPIMCIIEDDELAREVTERMIAAGAPVVETIEGL